MNVCVCVCVLAETVYKVQFPPRQLELHFALCHKLLMDEIFRYVNDVLPHATKLDSYLKGKNNN